MEQRRKLITPLTAALFGILTAYAICVTLYRNDLDSILKWGISLTLLTLGFGSLFFALLLGAGNKLLGIPAYIVVWGMILAVLSAIFFSLRIGFLFLLPLALTGFLLLAFTFPSLCKILEERRTFPFVIAWAISALVSFFVVGFLKNFYPSFLELVVLTVLSNVTLSVIFTNLLEQFAISRKETFQGNIVPLAILLLGLVFLVRTAQLVLHYPIFFSAYFFTLFLRSIPVFVGTALLSQGLAAQLLQILSAYTWRGSPLVTWIKRNLPGLSLAGTISASSYLIITSLVRYDTGFMDMFFQTDSPWWLNYLTLRVNELITMRAVHPFVLLILRPPVWLISLLLHGDKYHAALLLNSMMGGVCIFLAWWFFKKRTGNTSYALLMAALLGFSNSHLVLSSLLESYIFSAAALITFILLLQNEATPFWQLVLSGLLTFGITITNFIQTCIGFFVMRKDRLHIFKYVLIVLALAVLLAFIQHMFYPTSDPFYIPNRFGSETSNINLNKYKDMTRDEIVKDLASRVNITFRNTTLFSIVAPRPLVRQDEVNCTPLCFRVIERFRGGFKYASYVGFGSLLARTWFLGLIAAAVVYGWSLFKSPSRRPWLQTVLLLNILFNFALHIVYGEDPLLYSPDWTYALVFFFGMSFERWADRKWWQILLLLFITALSINNLELFRTIFETMLPFYS